jgi:plastocyanin
VDVQTAARICSLLITLLAIFAAACSDSDDSDDVTPAATAAEDASESPAGPALLEQPEPVQGIVADVTEPVSGTVEVLIEGVAFENNNLLVPLGAPIVIRVTNDDLQTHNLRIAGLDGSFETEDDAVTDPPSIAAGEAGELTFAPPVAGVYTFRCDIHPDVMGGQIAVE